MSVVEPLSFKGLECARDSGRLSCTRVEEGADVLITDGDVKAGVNLAKEAAEETLKEVGIQADEIGFSREEVLVDILAKHFSGDATRRLSEGSSLPGLREQLKNNMKHELTKMRIVSRLILMSVDAITSAKVVMEAHKSGTDLKGIDARHPLALQVMEAVRSDLIERCLGNCQPDSQTVLETVSNLEQFQNNSKSD